MINMKYALVDTAKLSIMCDCPEIYIKFPVPKPIMILSMPDDEEIADCKVVKDGSSFKIVVR